MELQSAVAQLPVGTAAELPLNKPADLTLPKLKNQSVQEKQPNAEVQYGTLPIYCKCEHK